MQFSKRQMYRFLGEPGRILQVKLGRCFIVYAGDFPALLGRGDFLPAEVSAVHAALRGIQHAFHRDAIPLPLLSKLLRARLDRSVLGHVLYALGEHIADGIWLEAEEIERRFLEREATTMWDHPRSYICAHVIYPFLCGAGVHRYIQPHMKGLQLS
jgi:hypothetical protein